MTKGTSRASQPRKSATKSPPEAGTKAKPGAREDKVVEPASRLIDQRIRDLGGWRGETLARMRALILEADPEMTEEWKWMGTPVWSHDGILCTGESYKNVVKLTFLKGASLKDPARLFNSSLDGNAPLLAVREERTRGAGAALRGGEPRELLRREDGVGEAEAALRVELAAQEAPRSLPAHRPHERDQRGGEAVHGAQLGGEAGLTAMHRGDEVEPHHLRAPHQRLRERGELARGLGDGRDVLGEEFGRVSGGLRDGRPRADALRALGTRNVSDDLKALVGLIVQSDKLGASMLKTCSTITAYGTKYYRVNVYRLLGAIFLGVGSDDGNLMLIRPKGRRPQAAGAGS